jgi:hypothetical protein
MLTRIGTYAQQLPVVLKWLRRVLVGPKTYQPGAHYMRGPGPKWHEKHPAQ